MKKLGVNIDHIATLRNVREYDFPNLLRSVKILENIEGVAYITIHLREDRRHIRDDDVELLCQNSALPINLEMACTQEMVEVALKNKPHSVCFVPEKREEMTTESGLNLELVFEKLAPAIKKLQENGIKCSLFLDPKPTHIHLAKKLNVEVIELHTGHYSNLSGHAQTEELNRLIAAAKLIISLGMECHAGHGLTFENIAPLAKVPEIEMFNIGHFLIGEAIYIGIEEATAKMLHIIKNA
jgi:pyridoxine 5-phosphate synthase